MCTLIALLGLLGVMGGAKDEVGTLVRWGELECSFCDG